MTSDEYAKWLESGSMTAKYLKSNGITLEQAQAGGLLPAQQAKRFGRDLEWLESIGHGRTELAHCLRAKGYGR